MGNSISHNSPIHHIFDFWFTEWKCMVDLDENLEDLQSSMLNLKARRDDLLRWVSIVEDRGPQDLLEVQRWISAVEKIESDANSLLSESTIQIQRRCMYGFCSKSYAATYVYCKKVVKALQNIETLSREGDFEVMAKRSPFTKKMPEIQPIASRERLLERAWDRLMDENVGTLGIYGMGGVGKTTLLKQINNKFSEAGRDVFDLVIFVVVGVDQKVQNIQDAIGGILGLQWGQETKEEKAAEIASVLKRKRFVLLLDDIWTEVDFEEIGVPCPSEDNRCKIVFTSRSRDAWPRYMVDAQVYVDCLPSQEAWDLFQQKVGESTLASHPDIPALARIVCQKCHGLPLAVTVIGESMASKSTVYEWHHAVNVLISAGTEFSRSAGDEIFLILKFSYDTLSDEKTKACFLYCALFPEDFDIRSQDLINYWVAEGFISHEIQGHNIIRDLVRVCLLVESKSGYGVKMHDVVRGMALWILSDFGKHEEHYVVVDGEGVQRMPKLNDWRMVARMSVTSTFIENISDSPQCPHLKTLFLQDNNKLKLISGDFFRWMSSLVVLDLSRNRELSALPEEISMLVALRYLSLLGTRIKDLPHGLRKLTQLIHLNLESTSRLQSISLISGLLKLQVLRFYGSAASLDFSLLEQLERLRDLKSLTVSVRDVDVLEAFLGSNLARCTRGIYLKGLKVSAASFTATLGELGSLSKLGMRECNIMESETEWEHTRRRQYSPSTTFIQITPDTWFKNLSAVVLFACIDLKDVTWLIYAANLESLTVQVSPKLEELISREKAAGVEDEPFLKLKHLRLEHLDKLKSIYWSPLSFPRLQKVDIINSPMLHQLPLSSTSVTRIDEFRMEVDDEWLEGVKWGSEAVQQRFLPVIRKASVSQLLPA